MFSCSTLSFLILDSLIRYARSSTWDGGCGLNLDLKMERRASSWHPGLSLNRVIYHNDLLKFIHWGCKAMSSTFNFNSVAEMVAMNAQPIIQSIPPIFEGVLPGSMELWFFWEVQVWRETVAFPTNLQYKAHFQSFLRSGYEASREPIDVRFREGGDGTIEPFSVQFCGRAEQDAHHPKHLGPCRAVRCLDWIEGSVSGWVGFDMDYAS